MFAKRFLPDLIVVAAALFAGPALLRMLRERLPSQLFTALRILIMAGSVL